MPFTATWHDLVTQIDELSEEATLLTPLSHRHFRIAETHEQRVIISFEDEDGYQPLQRDHFESLYRRIHDEPPLFDLGRLPADADPYPAVLSLHPRYEIDEEVGTITHAASKTNSSLLDPDLAPVPGDDEHSELDLALYPELLLLVDALERNDPDALDELETGELINLYTLLSDVQRGANELRKDVTDLLLPRLHHDQPVSGQYGSVQRTSRRRKSLKDDTAVLSAFEQAGIDRECVLGVDRAKVDEALEVTDLSEREVCEIDESTYVRKVEVDKELKDSRLQGLKDRLAATEGQDAAALQTEIEEATKGFEEALVEIPVTTSNNVMSVDASKSADVRVLAYSPATEGSVPMMIDQQLMTAAEPGDMGISRWTRVRAMLGGGPAEPFREHIESLIEQSAEIPSTLE